MAARALPTSAPFLVTAALLVSCGESRTIDALASPPRPRHAQSPRRGHRVPPRLTCPPTPLRDAVETTSPRAVVSDGRPRRATLTIPALGLHDLVVVPYRGGPTTRPAPASRTGGVAASPYGPRGGVGPGGLGNYQITAHRTSSTQAFRTLPSLRVGQRAVVTTGGVRYIYEIRRTRETSFRSPRSLAEQRAACRVAPVRPPGRAYLTLSTCATLEDHAQATTGPMSSTTPSTASTR